MNDLLVAAAHAPLAWALVTASVSAEAMRRARGRLRPRARRDGHARHADREDMAPRAGAPRVLVVRPCAGLEPHLERTLASLGAGRIDASVRCVFAVADADDSAVPAARAAVEALRAASIDAAIAITSPVGANRKAAQIAAVLAREGATFDVLVVADSDVDLAEVDLDALVAPLSRALPAGALRNGGSMGVVPSAVWAPPVEVAAPTSLGDRASSAVLGASLHAFPLLAGLDPRGLVGKLFAVRATALAEVGGFAALTAHLGEDMELSRRIHDRHGAIVAAPIVAPSYASGRTLRDTIARYARWIAVIRAQRPALLPSYPGLFFATPLIVALALVALPFAPTPAALAAAIAIASRLAVAAVAARLAGRPASLRAAAEGALLADLVLGAAFCKAMSSREVVWRSGRFTIDRRGLLREARA